MAAKNLYKLVRQEELDAATTGSGSGNISGTLTANKYTYSTGANTIAEGRISHTAEGVLVESLTGTTIINITDTASSFKYASGPVVSGVVVSSTSSSLQYGDATHDGNIQIGSTMIISHSHNIHLSAGGDIIFNDLTADTVPYIGSSNEFISSAILIGELNTLAGINQSQTIESRLASIASIATGVINFRSAYTPSGGNYPSTGGTGTSGAVKKGNMWIIAGVTGSATIGGRSVQNGDAIISLIDTPGNTDANWLIQEGNFGYTPLNQSLASAYFYVGNGSGIGTAVQMSNHATMSNTGAVTISAGVITDAMLVNTYLKANGTVQLSDNWITGAYKIITNTVTIGDDITALLINGSVLGAEINSLGDGLTINANGRGVVIDSDSIAVDIINGLFRFNDPNKGAGKTLVSDIDGFLSMKSGVYSLPAMTFATSTTNSTDTTVITGQIPYPTFSNDGDKAIYHLFIGNTGGTAGNVGYKIQLNGNNIGGNITLGLNTSSDPISAKVIIRRVNASTAYTTVEYNFSTHSSSLRTIYSGSLSIDFTADLTLIAIGNQLLTGRAISGLEGVGAYYRV